MRIDEKTFGYGTPIIVVADEEEAIKYANYSEFGLGRSIWTTNLDKAKKTYKANRVWNSNSK